MSDLGKTENLEETLADVIELKTYGYSSKEGDPVFRFAKASEIEVKQVDWVIDKWLAAGMVHLLAGQAERGKTGIALAVASMITNREFFPTGQQSKEGKVIIWTGEDSINHIVVPRLEAYGADLDEVLFVASERHGEFDPAIHMPQLEKLVDSLGDYHGVRLLIMDPILRVAAKVRNSNDPVQLRDALDNLRYFAERKGIAVLGITHFLKRHNAQGSGVLDRVIGSQAWGAVARVVWAVDYVKELQKNVLVVAKSNIDRKPDGLEYFIESAPNNQRVQKIRFGEPVPLGLAMMEQQGIDELPTKERASEARDTGEHIIINELMNADEHRMTWDELIYATEGECTKSTMRSARDSLKEKGIVIRIKAGYGTGSKTYWRLTDQYLLDTAEQEDSEIS